jgi:hypothetical protein
MVRTVESEAPCDGREPGGHGGTTTHVHWRWHEHKDMMRGKFFYGVVEILADVMICFLIKVQ